MSYKIICDSCTDLPKNLREDSHFHLIPLSIHIDNYTVVDDETFDQKDFLARVAACPNCPKTSCPSPESYKEFYSGDEDIYVVTLSSKLSGSYNSAELARKLYLEEHPNKNIAIFDSCSASAGQTVLAMKIQELAENGLSFENIVNEVKKHQGEMQTKFVLESLETLRKNGRLSNLKAIICNALNIKPIMRGTKEGSIEKLDQARGMQRALQKMVASMGVDAILAEEKICVVAHCNNKQRALYVKGEIEKMLRFKKVIIVDTAGISSFYAGDGGIVVSY